MPLIERLLVAAGFARTIYNQWRLQHIFTNVVMAIGLTIVSAVLTGALCIGGFYATYVACLHYGATPQNAVLFVGFLFLSVTLFFIALTLSYLQRMRQMPRKWMSKSPTVNNASIAIDAFLEGLTAED